LSLFSIAYGVIAGVGSYILLNGIPLAIRKLSGDRIFPANYDAKEPWIIPPGGIVPIWIQKLTGRYVDPRFEVEMEQRHELEMQRHDVVSMDTVSQDHIPRHDSSDYAKGRL
jgi:AGZA family xanthine/uracil permease-like MFS transporter